MILDSALDKAIQRLKEEGLLEEEITIEAKVLSAKEAIGNPEEYDFPLLKGKERIVEARFRDCRGHAFTDMYGGFSGPLNQVLCMPSTNNYRRSLQVATINAICNYWGVVRNTVHCKDNHPQACATECMQYIREQHPQTQRISLVGYQPAMADAIAQSYALNILDLDKENIGRERFGSVVLDGRTEMASALRWADVILATGSSVVNGTIDSIIQKAGDKPLIFYGVTIAGPAALLGLTRLCFAPEV